jgi:hypothetical protein
MIQTAKAADDSKIMHNRDKKRESMEHPSIHQGRLSLLSAFRRRGELLAKAREHCSRTYLTFIQAQDIPLSEAVLCIALAEHWDHVIAAAQWRHRRGQTTPMKPEDSFNAVNHRRCYLH